MEFRLIYKDGREVLFTADKPTTAVKIAFKMIGAGGKIKNYKFEEAGARAIYSDNKKIFPIP